MTYHEDHYKLKRFYASEWESYKTIRLEALTTNPELFGSSYVNELTYSREKWISLLENESRAIFALYHLDKLIGLTGVVLNRNNSSEAILISSFIQKPYRGMGACLNYFFELELIGPGKRIVLLLWFPIELVMKLLKQRIKDLVFLILILRKLFGQMEQKLMN